MRTIETIDEVKQAAAELLASRQPPDSNLLVTTERFIRESSRWKVFSYEAACLAGVADGMMLPETFLLRCPAGDWFREAPLSNQQKHVVDGEPVKLVRVDGRGGSYRIDHVPVRDLTKEDCKQLFGFCPKLPTIATAFDGDEVLFGFGKPDHKLVSITRIHRDA